MATITQARLGEALVAPLLLDARTLAAARVARPGEIDLALRLGAGHPRGPFEILDGARPEPPADASADGAPAVVGVVGTGVMATGIAEAVARGGGHVILAGRSPGAATRAVASSAARLNRAVARGKLSSDARDGAVARLTPAADLAALGPAELVVEAIVERLEDKRGLVGALERTLDAAVPIATNTSSLTVGDIGARAGHPERLLALHFFNPAPAMKLVEVVGSAATDPALVERGRAWARSIGKTPVSCRDESGFIVNRLLVPYLNDAARLRDREGFSVVEADTAVRQESRHPMGPFELMDLIGLDVMVLALETMRAAFSDDRLKPADGLATLAAQGRLGRKTGAGFHAYA